MKKNLVIALLIVTLPLIFIISCTKSSADEQTVVTPPGTCDTANMKYATDILPILESRCFGCHGTGNTGGSGGINLEGYNNLLPYVTSGSVKGNITHASGFVGMPYGEPKMDDCTINKILDWINQGAPNN